MQPDGNNTVNDLERRLVDATAPHDRIDAMNDLAWALWRVDAARGRELAAEALELARATDQEIPPYQRGIGYSLRALGWHELTLSNYESALAYSIDAPGILETVGDQYG